MAVDYSGCLSEIVKGTSQAIDLKSTGGIGTVTWTASEMAPGLSLSGNKITGTPTPDRSKQDRSESDLRQGRVQGPHYKLHRLQRHCRRFRCAFDPVRQHIRIVGKRFQDVHHTIHQAHQVRIRFPWMVHFFGSGIRKLSARFDHTAPSILLRAPEILL